jgi:hypothetical protein
LKIKKSKKMVVKEVVNVEVEELPRDVCDACRECNLISKLSGTKLTGQTICLSLIKPKRKKKSQKSPNSGAPGF